MGDRLLLDGTLRDGGYTNDWNCGADHARGIFSGLTEAGVDFVGVGFLDARGEEREGHTRFQRVASAEHLFTAMKTGASRKEATRLLAMVDLGTQERATLEILPCEESGLDGLRIMFKKEQCRDVMDICGGLNEKGYLVLLQPVSVTDYTQEELQDLIVDGSLYGMGKSAGNAPTELLAMHMNRSCGREFSMTEIVGAIEDHILPFYQPSTWGYGLDYFLAVLHACHPNYVHYFREQGLGARDIDERLARLPQTKRLRFEGAEARRAQEEM